jgi:hypothetical protein
MQLPATENMAMTVSFRPMIGTQASPLLNGRFGWRFYRWNSANDRCAQHKWVQLKIYWSSSGGFPDASTVTWGGNLFGVQGMTLRMFENEWWRWEVYYNGAYWTGVSSATIILTRLSTGVSYSSTANTWLWPNGPPLNGDGTPFSGEHDVHHEYRDPRTWPDGTPVTGTCTIRLSHLLFGHNLGSSERIPIATEFEGGTPAVPLNAPTNLRGCRGVGCTPASLRLPTWAYVERVWQWLVG